MTAGLLPERLRSEFGLGYTAFDRSTFTASLLALRGDVSASARASALRSGLSCGVPARFTRTGAQAAELS